MNIRHVTQSDVPELTVLSISTDNKRVERLLGLMEKGWGEYFTAEENGKIIGRIYLAYKSEHPHPLLPFVSDLRVHIKHRRKGIGTKLMNYCEQRAKEKGFNQIYLDVDKENNCPAYDMYIKRGYTEIPNTRHKCTAFNGDVWYCVDMKKDLNAA